MNDLVVRIINSAEGNNFSNDVEVIGKIVKVITSKVIIYDLL